MVNPSDSSNSVGHVRLVARKVETRVNFPGKLGFSEGTLGNACGRGGMHGETPLEHRLQGSLAITIASAPRSFRHEISRLTPVSPR